MSVAAFGLALLAGVAVLVIATGLPAYVALLLAAVLGALAGLVSGAITLDLLGALPARLFNLLENDLLQALPLYLLMGALLNRLGLAESLFRTFAAIARRGPAAPLAAGIGLGALLGPMNGSVGASVLAMTRTVGPRLQEAGVAGATREAVIAVAGTLGVVVPPSLVLILLGDALFVLLALVVSVLIGRRQAKASDVVPKPDTADLATSALALFVIVGLLGGVATGAFYAVEAAAAGAVLLFGWACAAGKLRGGELGRVLSETLVSTGVLFAPLLAATTFTLVLRLLGTDKLIEAAFTALPGGPAVVIAVALLCVAASALALDAFEIIFVVVPILAPPVLMRVPDAVWVGVLILLVLQTSFLLPPFGAAFILARTRLRTGASLGATVAALRPYLLAQIAVLALVLAAPRLVHLLGPSTAGAQAPVVLSPAEAEKRFRDMMKPPGAGLPALPPFPVPK